MIKSMLRCAAVLAAGAAVLVPTAPAHATVHEIVAQWCSGHEELGPPGISDDTKRNFAQPLNANGFIGGVTPFVGPEGPGLLIIFNFDHPASKVVPTGEVFAIPGTTPQIYVPVIAPDMNFAAFRNCPRLASG